MHIYITVTIINIDAFIEMKDNYGTFKRQFEIAVPHISWPVGRRVAFKVGLRRRPT